MILYCNHIAWHFEIHQKNPDLPWLMLLHGFMGSGEVFTPLLKRLKLFCNPVIVDLPGHGESGGGPNSEKYRTEKLTESLHILLGRLDLAPLFLHGYSMGGRLALQYAIIHQRRLKGLILESSTPGIDQEVLRAERRELDEDRARQILTNYPAFLEQWHRLPLFQSGPRTPDEALTTRNRHRELYERVMREQSPRTVAAVLRGFGTGSMPSLVHRLQDLYLPVCLLSGEADKKFCTVHTGMDRMLPDSRLRIIPRSGHRVHLDRPAHWATELETFINRDYHEMDPK